MVLVKGEGILGWLLSIKTALLRKECSCLSGSKAGAEPRAGLDELASTDAINGIVSLVG